MDGIVPLSMRTGKVYVNFVIVSCMKTKYEMKEYVTIAQE